ncbi:MAG: hypothetical protein EOP00_31955 [Pedobacter sp.]|nr:MAG: hypothetical protein EOP00_31955 [Pedobacter sp.]
MRNYALFCALALFLSCSLKSNEKAETQTYFSVSNYFKNEVARLSKNNPSIIKTVLVNGKAEEKKLQIKNWQQELSSFIEADINKASWKGSFQMIKSDTSEIYTSQSDKIPVKKLIIIKAGDSVKSVKIFLANENNLYTSNDSLVYNSDEFYEIKKTQKIKLMDSKRYVIHGKFH